MSHRLIHLPATLITRARTRLATTKEQGMATTEYAIVMVAAAAFAGVLVLILRSDSVRALLTGIVEGALATGS